MRITLIYTILIFLLTSCIDEGISNYLKGRLKLQEGKLAEAEAYFDAGILANSKYFADNLYGKAAVLHKLGRNNEAKEYLSSSLDKVSSSNEDLLVEIYWLRGSIFSEEGDKANALKFYQKSLLQDPDSRKLKTTVGYSLIENNLNQEAIEILTEVIENYNKSDCAYAYNNRSLAYTNLKRFTEAKNDLIISEKLDNKNPFLYKNYFHYHLASQNKEKACKSLNLAIQLDMNDYGQKRHSKELMELQKLYCR